jgi:hypothetical protein
MDSQMPSYAFSQLGVGIAGENHHVAGHREHLFEKNEKGANAHRYFN